MKCFLSLTTCLLMFLSTQEVHAQIIIAAGADAAFREKNYDRALSIYSDVIQKMKAEGSSPKSNYTMAEFVSKRAAALWRIGKKDDAVNALLGEQMKPFLVRDEFAVAVLEMMNHRLAQKPDDADALNWRASTYVHGGSKQYDLAIADYTRLIKLARNDAERADAYAERATPYRWGKQPERALQDLTKAIELNPHPKYYANRWRVHFGMGNLDKALADVNAMIALRSKGETYEAFEKCDDLITRSKLYKQMGSLDKALADVDAAIAADPKDGEAKGERILLLVEFKKLYQAKQELKALWKSHRYYYQQIAPKVKPLLEGQ